MSRRNAQPPISCRAVSAVLLGLVLLAGLSGCRAVLHPSKQEPFSFAQVCDTQLGMGGYEHDKRTFRQAVKQINALAPDFVVICGDLVGRPKDSTYADFNEIRAGFVIPCHCVPGNHDVGNEPTLASIERYREWLGEDYFSFDHKGYRFVCVNTQLWKAPVEGVSEAHDTWLRKTLAEASAAGLPVFVVGHYPLFTKSPDEKEHYYNIPLAKREELLELFEANGVVAIVTGHTHKVVVNEHAGIQMVSGQATSRTHGTPLGFRLWHVTAERPYVHEAIDLELAE